MPRASALNVIHQKQRTSSQAQQFLHPFLFDTRYSSCFFLRALGDTLTNVFTTARRFDVRLAWKHLSLRSLSSVIRGPQSRLSNERLRREDTTLHRTREGTPPLIIVDVELASSTSHDACDKAPVVFVFGVYYVNLLCKGCIEFITKRNRERKRTRAQRTSNLYIVEKKRRNPCCSSCLRQTPAGT